MKNSRTEHFETIYHQHQPMVLQMCLGFVKGDKDIANDLLQEVFISVWNNLEKFKGASTYKTWIYRITVNTCLQYIKNEKKEINDIEKQTEFIFEAIDSILKEADSSLDNVVKTVIYVKDVNDFSKISPIRNKYFEKSKPVSTLVEISNTVRKGCDIEIEVIAIKDL